MKPASLSSEQLSLPLARVRREPSGQFTAEIVGLAEVRATASTSEEAIEQVRRTVAEWIASGQLVPLAPCTVSTSKSPGWAKDDPLEQEFLADLVRMRQEDLEKTLREYEQEDQGCSGTSSTPTT